MRAWARTRQIDGPDLPQASATPRRQHHYPQLDALRGMAAVVVVLSHYLRLWEPASLSAKVRPALEVLQSLFNGTACVVLFFLLSGFVLSLPYKRRSELPYGVFLRRRLARIYLPYLAALLLALAADRFFQQQPVAVSAWFAQTWSVPLSWAIVGQHLLLIGNYDAAQLNTAFWSLAVEMRLSILFPLLCLPLLRAGRALAWALVMAIAVGQVAMAHFLARRMGAVGFINLTEFASGVLAFAAGILLARWLERVQSAWGSWPRVARVGLLVVCLGLLEWAGELGHTHLWPLKEALTVAGGAGVLIATLCSDRIRRMLNHRLPAWLGRVSYSLYLVHATVLFALVHAFFGPLTRLELLGPYLGLSLALAALFYFIVEKPAIHLSRSIGKVAPTPRAGDAFELSASNGPMQRSVK